MLKRVLIVSISIALLTMTSCALWSVELVSDSVRYLIKRSNVSERTPDALDDVVLSCPEMHGVSDEHQEILEQLELICPDD